MKSLATILLSFWILLGGMLPKGNVDELKKLPRMLAHFEKHKIENNQSELSFIDFIVLHYSPNSQHWEPEHATELPFFGSFVSGVCFFVQKLQISWGLETEISGHQKAYLFSFYQFLPLTGLLQPPRIKA